MPASVIRMPSARRLTVSLRLEDVVALSFFTLTLALRLCFHALRRDLVSPADVLIIIPAVALLVAKEIVHYFFADQGQLAADNRVPGGGVCDEERSALQGLASGSQDDLRNFARPFWNILRDWFPFLVILMMYYSLWGDATHLLVRQDRDAALIAWDQRLFGFQASLALQRFISPSLTAWMQFAYAFHVCNIPLVACFIYLRRPRERFREMMCGVLVITFLGLLGYILVPAVGPMYTLRASYTVPLSQPLTVLNRQIEFMDFVRIRRDVFPSLHVGLSFVVWLYARRNSRRLFWALAPLIVSLWVSTVYLRYHYLVDCVAGFFLAPLSFLLANWLLHRFRQISLTLPFAWPPFAQDAPLSPPTVPDRSSTKIIGGGQA